MNNIYTVLSYMYNAQNIPKKILFEHLVTIQKFPVEVVSNFCGKLPLLLK